MQERHYIVCGPEYSSSQHPVMAARNLLARDKMPQILRVIAGMGNMNSQHVADLPEGYFKTSGRVGVSMNPKTKNISLKGLYVPGIDDEGMPRARVLFPDKKAPRWFDSYCKFLAEEKSSIKIQVRITGLSGNGVAFVAPVHRNQSESENESIETMNKLSKKTMEFIHGDIPQSVESLLQVMWLMHHHHAEANDAYIVYHGGDSLKTGSLARDRRKHDDRIHTRNAPQVGDWVSYAVNKFGYLCELHGGHEVGKERLFNALKSGEISFGEAVNEAVKVNRIGLSELGVDWFNICGYSKNIPDVNS